MKKLMLFAAVAAIAGGAFAEGYTFTATLKTTKARAGKDVITTLNLGRLPTDAYSYWYDAGTNRLDAAYLTTKTIDGATVPALVKTKTKDGTTADSAGAYLINATNYSDTVATLKVLAAAYNTKSAGKWCETVKVVDPASCYRVAGTKKISQKFIVDEDYEDCCTVAGSGEPVFDNGLATITYDLTQTNTPISVGSTLYQRFGAQTSTAARKLEVFAMAEAPTTDGFKFAGWIAGQGTARAADSMEANAISGNIVGVVEAPVCENCCTTPTPSWAFDCENGEISAQLPFSAAYGTFRLAYNRNLQD